MHAHLMYVVDWKTRHENGESLAEDKFSLEAKQGRQGPIHLATGQVEPPGRPA